MKGERGWARKFAVEISNMLGGEKLGKLSSCKWKAPFDAAMKTTGAARSALLRAFVSSSVAADRFKWEQRSLDALAVFYAAKYKLDERDSLARARTICKEASDLFCEEMLELSAVQVSRSDDKRCLAKSMHCSILSIILRRRNKR